MRPPAAHFARIRRTYPAMAVLVKDSSWVSSRTPAAFLHSSRLCGFISSNHITVVTAAFVPYTVFG